MNISRRTTSILGLSLLFLACGNAENGSADGALATDTAGSRAKDRPLPDRLGSIERDLEIGSAGDDVRALHEYLTQYGYFPNAKLAEQYPRWRPAVPQSPADEGVFDAGTADALRHLQVNSSLEPTGIVDAATRKLLTTPRCGVPDGMIELDSADKWALLGSITSNTLVRRWSLVGTPDDGLSAAEISVAVNAAAASWMAQSSLNIMESPAAGARISVTFADLGPWSPATGGALGNCSGGGTNSSTIRLNKQVSWCTQSPTPDRCVDVQSVVLHELGHALGLDHSAFDTPARATMFPTMPTSDRSLDDDDNLGMSTLWDTYQQLPGAAIDIGASTNGSVWVVGTDNRPYRWNGSNWDLEPTGIISRIAVDSLGFPWAVAPDNSIWRFSSNLPNNGGVWQQKPGAAVDVGVGNNFSVWVVGTDTRVYKWNGIDNWIATSAQTSARRISVTPSGRPWVVTTSNGLQRFTTNDPATGTWENREAPAEDIGVGLLGSLAISNPKRGQDGAVFKTDRGSLLVFDEQDGVSGAPTVTRWRIAGDNRGLDFVLPVGPIAVSVGRNGKPWVIGANGAIYTTLR